MINGVKGSREVKEGGGWIGNQSAGSRRLLVTLRWVVSVLWCEQNLD